MCIRDSDKPSRMDYRQHQAARRLVHECCNYDEGNCLLLDDGEPCVCVQSISYSVSYTHLDVYKRQVQCYSLCIWEPASELQRS